MKQTPHFKQLQIANAIKNTGLTLKEISKEFGLGRATVSDIKKRWGIESGPDVCEVKGVRRWTTEEVTALKERLTNRAVCRCGWSVPRGLYFWVRHRLSFRHWLGIRKK